MSRRRSRAPSVPTYLASLARSQCPECRSRRLRWSQLAAALGSPIAVDVANLIDGAGVVSADVWECLRCGEIGVIEQ